ncbi:hypothetical protein DFA_04903 [Cavenderia fasciculata]|uniref:Uncharacterized protein n=1 Tax=Cavenderia fasciculata TaxID=261658 RepID=F4PMC3_CACFS|nr:uncharacterized protein DFA_04903 [Cavenderia fasciculata]EGG22773.1 hypothetical protein DFA_04903 [Cavenderia fasciculata]|eukprot:XP_004360624.1 hypothetical protein DFA_04903 [Cavenderia fasciculata]
MVATLSKRFKDLEYIEILRLFKNTKNSTTTIQFNSLNIPVITERSFLDEVVEEGEIHIIATLEFSFLSKKLFRTTKDGEWKQNEIKILKTQTGNVIGFKKMMTLHNEQSQKRMFEYSLSSENDQNVEDSSIILRHFLSDKGHSRRKHHDDINDGFIIKQTSSSSRNKSPTQVAVVSLQQQPQQQQQPRNPKSSSSSPISVSITPPYPPTPLLQPQFQPYPQFNEISSSSAAEYNQQIQNYQYQLQQQQLMFHNQHHNQMNNNSNARPIYQPTQQQQQQQHQQQQQPSSSSSSFFQQAPDTIIMSDASSTHGSPNLFASEKVSSPSSSTYHQFSPETTSNIHPDVASKSQQQSSLLNYRRSQSPYQRPPSPYQRPSTPQKQGPSSPLHIHTNNNTEVVHPIPFDFEGLRQNFESFGSRITNN